MRKPKSEEMKQMLSKVHKGKVPWNKGKTDLENQNLKNDLNFYLT